MRTKQNPLHPAGPGASPSRQPLAGSGVTVAVRGSSRRGLTKAVRDFARALA